MKYFLLLIYALVPLFDFGQSSNSSWFKVSEVAPAKNKLHELTGKEVVETATGFQMHVLPQEFQDKRLVFRHNNGFLQAVHESFDSHRPLSISPDHIMMLISLGVSQHINANFQEYKSRFFLSQERKELAVRNDSLKVSTEAWVSLINQFVKDAHAEMKVDIGELFVANFSTTTPAITTALHVAELETYKQAFEYLAETGCGIPQIQLQGTLADWQALYAKLDLLQKVDMGWWAESLRPVLLEFIEAKKGKVNLPFWKDLYKNEEDYGATFISGWIIKFFPYLTDLDYDNLISETKIFEGEEYEEFKAEKKTTRNPFLQGKDYLKSNVTTEQIPEGFSRVPLTWNDFTSNISYKLEMCGGFFGIAQGEDLSLSPHVGWCVVNTMKEAPSVETYFDEDYTERQEHQVIEWSLQVYRDPKQPAFFTKKGRTGDQTRELGVELGLLLESKGIFDATHLKEHYLEVEILMDGSMGDVVLKKGDQQVPMDSRIMATLKSIAGTWTPAKVEFADFVSGRFEALDVMEFDANGNPVLSDPAKNGKQALYAVNSVLVIEF